MRNLFNKAKRILFALVLILILIVVVSVGVFTLVPLSLERIISQPMPAQTYDEAIKRFQSIQLRDATGVNPLCTSQMLTHGQKVKGVIVLLHGYTNCPQQFVPLGKQLFDTGYNVLITRMPQMGLADRMDPAQGTVTAEEMARWGDESVDIASGLGETVTVVGLSAGGEATAWVAQKRPEVTRAVVIAPSFAITNVPAFLTRPFAGFVLTVPNQFLWWDPVNKENLPGPTYGYPRLSSRPLGEMIRFGFAIENAAAQDKPAAASIVMVTNANDQAVNNGRIDQVVAAWNSHIKVERYEFDGALKLPHDIIDPNQPKQNVNLVYPILTKLITGS